MQVSEPRSKSNVIFDGWEEATRLLLTFDPDVKGNFQLATALSVIFLLVNFCIMATLSHLQQRGNK